MNRLLKIVFIILTGIFIFACNTSNDASQNTQSSSPEGYAGSVSCRDCHGKFYELWSTSFHGLAMQPYTKEFAQNNLIPQKESIKINDSEYRFDVDNGVVIERSPKGKKEYWVKHVMGGKYVYFFLTLMERGRLQVLPVSYDVRKKPGTIRHQALYVTL